MPRRIDPTAAARSPARARPCASGPAVRAHASYLQTEIYDPSRSGPSVTASTVTRCLRRGEDRSTGMTLTLMGVIDCPPSCVRNLRRRTRSGDGGNHHYYRPSRSRKRHHHHLLRSHDRHQPSRPPDERERASESSALWSAPSAVRLPNSRRSDRALRVARSFSRGRPLPPEDGYSRRTADVAQLVEHFTRNEGVPGSSPGVGSQKRPC